MTYIITEEQKQEIDLMLAYSNAVSVSVDNLGDELDHGKIEAIREELRVALNESLGV